MRIATSLAFVAVLLCVELAATRAESVVIGRFSRVVFGIDHAHPYVMVGGDGRRTGRSRLTALHSRPRPLWSIETGQSRLTPPAVLSDGTLVVGGQEGLKAYDAQGKLRWFAPVGAVRHTPSVTTTGELLVATRRGRLFIVDANGTWRRMQTEVQVRGAPLVLDSGVVVVGGRDGSVHAMDMEGAEILTLRGQHKAPVTVSVLGDGLLASAGVGSRLSIFSLDGGRLSEIELSQRSVAGPVVGDDSTIWIVGEHGGLRGLSAGGRSRGLAELGRSALMTAPAIGRDGALRVGVRRFELVCLGPNGTERWRRGLDGQPGPVTLDANDVAIFVTTRGTLYALDHDGSLLWKQDVTARSAPRPVLGVGGTIYIATRSGTLMAWR